MEDDKKLEELAIKRKEEIKTRAKNFLTETVLNMIEPVGISGVTDIALKINRTTLIGEVLIELGKELLNEQEL